MISWHEEKCFHQQMFTYSLIVTDGVNLRAEHHSSENEEEQTLKAQEDEEDDGRRRREGTAL